MNRVRADAVAGLGTVKGNRFGQQPDRPLAGRVCRLVRRRAYSVNRRYVDDGTTIPLHQLDGELAADERAVQADPHHGTVIVERLMLDVADAGT